MKGIIGKVAAILGMMTFLAACSPAAAPHGGRSTANRVADTAKTAGKQGRHTVGQAARGITRDVKKLPGKAMHGTRRLAREGSHTAKKLGMGGRGRTAASGSVRGGFAAGTAPALKVIGFVTTDNTKGPNGSPGLDYLARTPDAVTYLSPLFYAVEKDGSLRSHYVAGVVAFARAHRIKVMPLINNAGGNHAFLDDPKARDNAVKNIADMVNARHFDGVSIDFQLLPDTSRVSLNTFMDELSGRLRPLHKIITINVIPTQAQTGDHGAYDEHTLARYADQLILMSYDRHNDSSSPGPVSPHDWVVQAVTHALQQGVPAAKIYLGVNTYGYDWNTTRHTAMTVPMRLAKTAPNIHWDAAVKEAHIAYRDVTGLHVAWFGTERSLKDKIAIARRYHLYGLAIWKVGYEDKSFWKTLVADNGSASATAAARASRPPLPMTFRGPAPRTTGQLPMTGIRALPPGTRYHVPGPTGSRVPGGRRVPTFVPPR